MSTDVGPSVPVAPAFTSERAAQEWELALPRLWSQYYAAFVGGKSVGWLSVDDGGKGRDVRAYVRCLDGDEGRLLGFGGDRLLVDGRVEERVEGNQASVEDVEQCEGVGRHLVADSAGEPCDGSVSSGSRLLEGRCDELRGSDDRVVVGTGIQRPCLGSASEGSEVKVKSKNARKRASQRARRAAAKAVGVSGSGCLSEERNGAGLPVEANCEKADGFHYSYRDVTTAAERKAFARQWFERRSVENELAIQRGRYNVKRNDYMLSSRISEKKWECDRLRCEEKLANINRLRFGSKPGYAETLASLSDGSEKPPSLSTGTDSPASLSDGTVSPNSSMSVAEECKLRKKLEEMSEEVAQLKLERDALTTSRACTGGKVVVEDGRVHVYDGIGQYVPPTPVYGSECALSMGDYPEELQRYCDPVH